MYIVTVSQRCIFEALEKFMILIFKLYLGTPLLFSRNTRKRKSISFKVWGEMGGKLKFSTEMLKLCFITDLIRFVVNEVEKLMKGLVYRENLFVVHDDLVLMRAK